MLKMRLLLDPSVATCRPCRSWGEPRRRDLAQESGRALISTIPKAPAVSRRMASDRWKTLWRRCWNPQKGMRVSLHMVLATNGPAMTKFQRNKTSRRTGTSVLPCCGKRRMAPTLSKMTLGPLGEPRRSHPKWRGARTQSGRVVTHAISRMMMRLHCNEKPPRVSNLLRRRTKVHTPMVAAPTPKELGQTTQGANEVHRRRRDIRSRPSSMTRMATKEVMALMARMATKTRKARRNSQVFKRP
mmetsp:Transcript_106744/g.300024  ORF Transcript_106744/g.300024 Transcript_106744/m.300024 type:complete len:243 (-) Transcript_106744:189-917(-)